MFKPLINETARSRLAQRRLENLEGSLAITRHVYRVQHRGGEGGGEEGGFIASNRAESGRKEGNKEGRKARNIVGKRSSPVLRVHRLAFPLVESQAHVRVGHNAVEPDDGKATLDSGQLASGRAKCRRKPPRIHFSFPSSAILAGFFANARTHAHAEARGNVKTTRIRRRISTQYVLVAEINSFQFEF